MSPMSLAADAATAGVNRGPAIAFCAVLTVLAWVGVITYGLPALRSQQGRPERLPWSQRLRRIAIMSFWSYWPVALLGFLIALIFATEINVFWSWLAIGVMVACPLLWALSFIVRTVERHRARVDRGNVFGVPTPRGPWWPTAASGLWVAGVIGALVVATRVAYSIYVSRPAIVRGMGVDAVLKSANQDPSVRQLVASHAGQAAIDARVDQLTSGALTEARGLMTAAWWFIGVAIAVWLTGLVVAAVGGVKLYRRQQERRQDYETEMTAAMARAARLRPA